MTFVRLGDLIPQVNQPATEGNLWRFGDNLAQRVFNAGLDIRQNYDFYVQSSKTLSRPNSFQWLDENLELGNFETLLISKIMNPINPILCVVGPMGSGKSTTIRYILHLLNKRKNINGDDLIAQIDFNQHLFLVNKQGNDEKLNEYLYNLLCDEMIARISQIELEDHDLVMFWNYEIELYKSRLSSSLAFRKLLAKLGSEIFGQSNQEQSKSLDTSRKNAFILLNDDLPAKLDYLIRLWMFIYRSRYLKNNSKSVIVFDNLDAAPAFIQRQLLDIVFAHAQKDGPLFILLLRPETFSYIGLGTGIVDIEEHKGPSIIEVFNDRLSRVCKEPDRFYNNEDTLSKNDFNIIIKFLRCLFDFCIKNPNNAIIRFLSLASGQSLRLGLRIAQSLFRVNISVMSDPNIKKNVIIRTMIAEDQGEFRWTPTSTIHQLFRISESTGLDYLVKPRILKFLSTHPDGSRIVNEIKLIMGRFGYGDIVIRHALNDLMRLPSQLIRSNGFDYYEDRIPFNKFDSQQIKITEIGMNYISEIITSLDYIQEVMLDTWIKSDNFPRYLESRDLVGKLQILYYFLREVNEIDVIETRAFLATFGIFPYYESFGQRMISLDIIQSIYPAVEKIYRSMINNLTKDKFADYDELISQFSSLTLLSEAQNVELLGINVNSVVNSLR